MDFKVIENPPEGWVKRLRPGNYVWLVKEGKPAEICFPFVYPEPGHKTGRLGVRHGILDSWFIDENGRGIDYSLLMLPIEGYLLENPPDLPPNYVLEIHKTLNDLRAENEYLQRAYEHISRADLILALKIEKMESWINDTKELLEAIKVHPIVQEIIKDVENNMNESDSEKN